MRTASTCGLRPACHAAERGSARAPVSIFAPFAPIAASIAASGVASVLVCAVLAGCTASSEDVRAPQNQLFFPTGLAVSPDDRTLFVANANAELRYDSGAISVVDLQAVDAILTPWVECQRHRVANPNSPPCDAPAGCAQDPDHSETITCDPAKQDPSSPVGQFLRRDAGVRIGNFATDLAIQDFSSGGVTKLRVFVPTRGDPSIAWADFDGTNLRCTAGSTGYALCDDPHRLTQVLNDPDLGLPIEPFGVHVDAKNGFAMVTHLSDSAITLIDAPADSDRVQIVDLIGNVFIRISTNASTASAIAGRLPGTPDTVVYTGSTLDNRIQTFTVGRRDNAAAFLLPGTYFFQTAVGTTSDPSASSDTRGIKFSSNGDRMYLANRSPPSLQVYDTRIGPTGIPLNQPTGSSDICREASTLTVVDLGPGIGDRVYVTCFQDGQLYVVNPSGQSQVEDIITVGRGPYAVAGSQAKQRLFVSNFLEDTIAVIDIAPDSPTRDRVVLRIGTPRVP